MEFLEIILQNLGTGTEACCHCLDELQYKLYCNKSIKSFQNLNHWFLMQKVIDDFNLKTFKSHKI